MKNDEGNGLPPTPASPNYRKMISDRKQSASLTQIPAALSASTGVLAARISQQSAVRLRLHGP
jgi:hypothetical protein